MMSQQTGDLISREMALKECHDIVVDGERYRVIQEETLLGLPPINPQKTGHWKAKSFHEVFCDNCGFDFDIMRNDFIDKMNFCPKCGCRMVEPQESEDK